MRRLTLSACALRFFDTFLLIVPFYAVMFAEKGLRPAEIGVVLTAWSLTGLVLEVPCGALADRTSRRWLLAVAQLVRCAGFLVWIAFPTFWGFLIGLMLWGLKSATFNGAFEAVVYDELKALGREDEYARIIGRTQAARAGGGVCASLIAAVVVTQGYTLLNIASAVAGLAAAASALTLPHAPKAITTTRWGYFSHLKQGVAQAATLPGVPTLLVFIAGMQAVVMACADYWPLFAKEVGLPKPGIALFMAATAGMAMGAAIVAHRFRALSLTQLRLLLMASGAGLMFGAATYQLWSLVLVLGFVGFYWIVDVNADARFQHALKPETRATVGSVKGFAMQAGTSLMMLLLGVTADLTGAYRTAFVLTGIALTAWAAAFALTAARPRAATDPTAG